MQIKQNYKFNEKDRKYLVDSINRLTGVINSAKNDIEEDHACLETISKLVAARGAINKVVQEMVSRGVLKCVSDYSEEELEIILKTLLK